MTNKSIAVIIPNQPIVPVNPDLLEFLTICDPDSFSNIISKLSNIGYLHAIGVHLGKINIVEYSPSTPVYLAPAARFLTLATIRNKSVIIYLRIRELQPRL